jgi:hypothetical protein
LHTGDHFSMRSVSSAVRVASVLELV